MNSPDDPEPEGLLGRCKALLQELTFIEKEYGTHCTSCGEGEPDHYHACRLGMLLDDLAKEAVMSDPLRMQNWDVSITGGGRELVREVLAAHSARPPTPAGLERRIEALEGERVVHMMDPQGGPVCGLPASPKNISNGKGINCQLCLQLTSRDPAGLAP